MTTTPGSCRPCDDAPPEPARDNPPGQPAIAWRLGDHAAFLERMLLRLPRVTVPPPLGAPPGTPDLQPLASLNTRAPDDPSIALLDAFAVTADVLAFYQERIVNEGFLRTATERMSVLELARAVGYELKPGVAAGTLLAFTLDEPVQVPVQVKAMIDPSTASPRRTTIAIGTKVQSVPGPGELPQTFETVEQLEARREHNTLLPRLAQPQQLAFAGSSLKLVGLDGTQVAASRILLATTASGLKVGDVLVLRDGGAGAGAFTVYKLAIDQASGVTAVDLVDGLSPSAVIAPPVPAPVYPPPPSTGVIDATPQPLDLAYVQTSIVGKTWTEEGLAAMIEIQRWDEDQLLALVGAVLAARTGASEAHALRQRMTFFGAGAPAYKTTVPPTPNVTAIGTVLAKYTASDFTSKRDEIASAISVAAQPYATTTSNPNDWDAGGGRSIWTSSTGTSYQSSDSVDVFLERSVPDVIPGSWIVVRRSGKDAVYSVTATVEQSRVDYATTAKVTGLRLGDVAKQPIAASAQDGGFKVRTTQALVQSERLPLATLPIADVLEEVATLSGQTVRRGARALVLDRMVLGLTPGRSVILSGTVAPPYGSTAPTTAVTRREAVTLAAVIHQGGTTTLYFTGNLAERYLRATVTLAANIARATHGETVPREILGSGQASVANQRFALKRPPLTFVSAPTPSGTDSTLVVRVDDVAWQEVPSLYGAAPDAPVYTLRTNDDGVTTVIFGDGAAGARLPTGLENVVATYRAGLGVAGEVGADKLTILQSRPLGVRSVTNPLAASGGEDRESLDDARANAPLAVLTLDRIVSLRDYEDFTRAFAGISKAQARPVWNGHQQLLHVTIASASGGAVDPSSDLYRNLADGIAAASDGTRTVQLDSFQPLLFELEAELDVDARHDTADVQAAAAAALTDAFSFDARALGQRVTEAEVLTVLQGIDGVVGARLATLAYVTAQGGAGSAAVDGILAAQTARWDAASQKVLPAELLTLHPAGATLTAVVAP
ncbi:MAG TPA: putative baseplate assembly protein [Kofleriaceae bacterium]|nr:putative baseplate assembly protein [Kofleriaceae bacterium]